MEHQFISTSTSTSISSPSPSFSFSFSSNSNSNSNSSSNFNVHTSTSDSTIDSTIDSTSDSIIDNTNDSIIDSTSDSINNSISNKTNLNISLILNLKHYFYLYFFFFFFFILPICTLGKIEKEKNSTFQIFISDILISNVDYIFNEKQQNYDLTLDDNFKTLSITPLLNIWQHYLYKDYSLETEIFYIENTIVYTEKGDDKTVNKVIKDETFLKNFYVHVNKKKYNFFDFPISIPIKKNEIKKILIYYDKSKKYVFKIRNGSIPYEYYLDTIDISSPFVKESLYFQPQFNHNVYYYDVAIKGNVTKLKVTGKCHNSEMLISNKIIPENSIYNFYLNDKNYSNVLIVECRRYEYVNGPESYRKSFWQRLLHTNLRTPVGELKKRHNVIKNDREKKGETEKKGENDREREGENESKNDNKTSQGLEQIQENTGKEKEQIIEHEHEYKYEHEYEHEYKHEYENKQYEKQEELTKEKTHEEIEQQIHEMKEKEKKTVAMELVTKEHNAIDFYQRIKQNFERKQNPQYEQRINNRLKKQTLHYRVEENYFDTDNKLQEQNYIPAQRIISIKNNNYIKRISRKFYFFNIIYDIPIKVPNHLYNLVDGNACYLSDKKNKENLHEYICHVYNDEVSFFYNVDSRLFTYIITKDEFYRFFNKLINKAIPYSSNNIYLFLESYSDQKILKIKLKRKTTTFSIVLIFILLFSIVGIICLAAKQIFKKHSYHVETNKWFFLSL